MFRRLFWVSIVASFSLILMETVPSLHSLAVYDTFVLLLIAFGLLLFLVLPLTAIFVLAWEGTARSWHARAPQHMTTPSMVFFLAVYVATAASSGLKVGLAVGKFAHRNFRQTEYQHLAILLSSIGVCIVFLMLYAPIQRGGQRILQMLSKWSSVPNLSWLVMAIALWVSSAIYIWNLPALFPLLDSVSLRPLWMAWMWLGVIFVGRFMPFPLHFSMLKTAVLLASLASIGPWMVDGLLVANYASVSHVERHTILTKKVLSAFQKLTDDDADGVSDRFGGADCDDQNARITPGRLDLPNDGIDQNCTGQDHQIETKQRIQAQPLPPKRPQHNVILLTIDALRFDRLETDMPFLNRLSQSSLHFRHAYSHGASTYWSVPALLGSKLPSALEMGRDQTPVGHEILLPEILLQNGWRTNLFANVTIFFVRGLSQGFRHKDKDYATSHFTVHGAKPGAKHMTQGMLRKLRALTAAKEKKPIFMWGHYYDPHDPYFEVDGFPADSSDDFDRYRAICRSVDASIETFVDGLKSMGLWENTILVITSDHGDEFGEHGGRFHGKSLYDEMTRVPLIMRVPGVAPREIETPVGQMDVAPTLLGLLGLRAPQSFVGVNHAEQLLSNADIGQTPVLMEVLPDSNYDGHILGARVGYKKVLYHPRRHYFEVYDLQKDAQERMNIAHAHPELRTLILSHVDDHLFRLALGKTGAKLPKGTPRGFGKRHGKKR